MKKKKSKYIYIIPSILLLPFVLVALAYGYLRSIQPIFPGYSTSDSYYFKDLFGQIFIREYLGGLVDLEPLFPYKKVQGIDSRTFQVLETKIESNSRTLVRDSGYAKDQFHVYYEGKIVAKADPASFFAIGESLGRDTNQYFMFNMALLDSLEENNIAIEEKPFEILSYFQSHYMVIEQSSEFFFVELNPDPKAIKKITKAEALAYPPLKAE